MAQLYFLDQNILLENTIKCNVDSIFKGLVQLQGTFSRSNDSYHVAILNLIAMTKPFIQQLFLATVTKRDNQITHLLAQILNGIYYGNKQEVVTKMKVHINFQHDPTEAFTQLLDLLRLEGVDISGFSFSSSIYDENPLRQTSQPNILLQNPTRYNLGLKAFNLQENEVFTIGIHRFQLYAIIIYQGSRYITYLRNIWAHDKYNWFKYDRNVIIPNKANMIEYPCLLAYHVSTSQGIQMSAIRDIANAHGSQKYGIILNVVNEDESISQIKDKKKSPRVTRIYNTFRESKRRKLPPKGCRFSLKLEVNELSCIGHWISQVNQILHATHLPVAGFSLIWSDADTVEQETHIDYPTLSSHEKPQEWYPLACLIALDDNVSIIIENKGIHIPKFSALVFRGDLKHSGGSWYDCSGDRIHGYIDTEEHQNSNGTEQGFESLLEQQENGTKRRSK